MSLSQSMPRDLSRRSVLGGGLAASAALLAACSGGSSTSAAPASSFANDADRWMQAKGTKLTFITENTPPSTGIKKIVERGDFKKLTGIDVEVLQFDLPVMLQKAELDLQSGTKAYDLIYGQDKPVLSALADYYVDLKGYLTDTSLPQAKEGYADDTWLPNYAGVADYAYTHRTICLPYDSADSVFCYRRDLFEKYGKQFADKFGYAMKYGPESTYKNVLDFAGFFKKLHESDSTVPYGMGLHLGQFAWTTQLDVQRILYSHGQWRDFEIDDILGSKTPGPTNWGNEQSIKGLELYKALYDTSTPDALSLGTVEVADAYNAGKVAMLSQFHEFASSFEADSSAGGGSKTAYDVCPKGDASYLVGSGQLVNGTNCGIAGIGINSSISDERKRAAYIFCVWSTSAAVQQENLGISGGTPTRASVPEVAAIKSAQGRPYGTGSTGRIGPSKFPNALTFPAITKGMATPNAILGPKIPKFNQYVTIVATEVQKLCAGQSSPEACAKSIKTQTDQLNGV